MAKRPTPQTLSTTIANGTTTIPPPRILSLNRNGFVVSVFLTLFLMSYAMLLLRALTPHRLFDLPSLSTPLSLHRASPPYFRTSTTSLHRLSALTHLRCPFSLIYNKPPKTAGTHVQRTIRYWANATNPKRYFHNCRGFRAIEANLYFRDCLPDITAETMHNVQPPPPLPPPLSPFHGTADDGCHIVSSHMLLTPHARKLLHRRLPTAKTMTTTRYPPHRLVSSFLQVHGLSVTDLTPGGAGDRVLLRFLRAYNPWWLYNFHTGEARTGTCPLNRAEQQDVLLLAARYDFVVDASLVEESNAILRAHGLFQLEGIKKENGEDGGEDDRINDRGTRFWNVSAEARNLLRNVSCVEDELHRALHVRMASLYEYATGKECIRHGRVDALSSCMDEREKQILSETSWL